MCRLVRAQVSRLQVAELVAAAALDVDLAENKVLEVVAETSAPQLSYQALLKGIESDISAVRAWEGSSVGCKSHCCCVHLRV